MNIVNVGYDSTNYYVIASAHARLLVDVGFPGTLPKLHHQLKVKGLALRDIAYLLCTHYHPDHAGLAQEVKQQGVQLVVLQQQLAAIPLLRQYTKPAQQYQEILLQDVVRLSRAASRAWLHERGIAGEIIGTPGHSDDSVSLVLDTGAACIGDLEPALDSDEPAHQLRAQSWRDLRALGVQQLYPGHGPVRPLRS